MKRQRLPHKFEPGKDPKFPGPYCKFCHYSVFQVDGGGPCCKRPMKRERKAAITDRKRMNELQKQGRKIHRGTHTVLQISWPNKIGLRRTIDLAIRSTRRGGRKA